MKSILIVEDQADIRRLICMTLEFEACRIYQAEDALTGWDMVRELKPDVLLLDWMMPGDVNGLDLCRAVRNDPSLSHVAVVMLSARGSAENEAEGLRAGAAAYLIKPFSPMQLLETLGRFGL